MQEREKENRIVIDEVWAYFDMNPRKFIDYIERAIKLKCTVLGVYLRRLERLAGEPLETKGDFPRYPSNSFCNLKYFTNLREVVQLARLHTERR